MIFFGGEGRKRIQMFEQKINIQKLVGLDWLIRGANTRVATPRVPIDVCNDLSSGVNNFDLHGPLQMGPRNWMAFTGVIDFFFLTKWSLK